MCVTVLIIMCFVMLVLLILKEILFWSVLVQFLQTFLFFINLPLQAKRWYFFLSVTEDYKTRVHILHDLHYHLWISAIERVRNWLIGYVSSRCCIELLLYVNFWGQWHLPNDLLPILLIMFWPGLCCFIQQCYISEMTYWLLLFIYFWSEKRDCMKRKKIYPNNLSTVTYITKPLYITFS